MPKYSVPKVQVPKYSVPKVQLPKYSVPKYSVPKYSVPKYSVPKNSVPKYRGARFVGRNVTTLFNTFNVLVIILPAKNVREDYH